jgi:hypothetical protein
MMKRFDYMNYNLVKKKFIEFYSEKIKGESDSGSGGDDSGNSSGG